MNHTLQLQLTSVLCQSPRLTFESKHPIMRVFPLSRRLINNSSDSGCFWFEHGNPTSQRDFTRRRNVLYIIARMEHISRQVAEEARETQASRQVRQAVARAFRLHVQILVLMIVWPSI